jgi:hypothetical protein
MVAISILSEIAPIMDQLLPVLHPVYRLRVLRMMLSRRINGDGWETVERTVALTLGPVPNIQLIGKQVRQLPAAEPPPPSTPQTIVNVTFVNMCGCNQNPKAAHQESLPPED